jgi:hypothetical protein
MMYLNPMTQCLAQSRLAVNGSDGRNGDDVDVVAKEVTTFPK